MAKVRRAFMSFTPTMIKGAFTSFAETRDCGPAFLVGQNRTLQDLYKTNFHDKKMRAFSSFAHIRDEEITWKK